MPANRRQRRAATARTRHAPTRQATSLPPLARAGLALAGMLLVVLAVFVIVTPRSIHVGRGFFFLLVVGVGLIYLAMRRPGA
jgi:hypothetical protein